MTASMFLVVALAAPPPDVDLPLETALTAGAGAGWGALWLWGDDLTPARCPCGDEPAVAFDAVAVGADWGPGERLADAVAATTLIAPLALLAAESSDPESFGREALLVAEAVVAAGLLTQATKVAVGRPYPYLLADDADPALFDDGINYQSFWSGHTAVPMAAAVSFAWGFQRRHPRSPWRWVVWVAGPALALTAGALQATAGNHYPTDIAAGALVGAGVGVAVPWLHE